MRTLSLAGLMRTISAWIPTSILPDVAVRGGRAEGDRRSCATRFAGLNKQLRDGKREADRCASCASEKRRSVKRRGFLALQGRTNPRGWNEREEAFPVERMKRDTKCFLDQTDGIVTPPQARRAPRRSPDASMWLDLCKGR